MASPLYVATRKGLFRLRRSAWGEWDIQCIGFLAEPVSMMLEDPRDGTIYAALDLGHFGAKLHRSLDGGRSWTEIPAPAFPNQPPPPADPSQRPARNPDAPSVRMIWSLEAGGPGEPGVLWAGTLPGALFRSPDAGESWKLNEPLWNRPERQQWMGGGYDVSGVHSILVNPRNARHLTLGVSIGGVWVSTDGGDSWHVRGKGLRAEYLPPELAHDPVQQDPHRVVACAARPEVLWAQHHNGVFRSTDGGDAWTEIRTVEPSVFGFTVAVHPKNPDIAWFVPAQKDERRVPVGAKLVVARTRDGGQSFEVLNKGLPKEDAYDLVYRHALDVDAEGELLAFGSTTGNLWVSENGGDAWTCVTHHLPPIYAVRFGRYQGGATRSA